MKKLVIFLFFIPIAVYSQLNLIYSKKLVWSVNSYYINGKTYRLLAFKDAIIDGRLLPYYSEFVSVRNYQGGMVKYKVLKMNTEYVSNEELSFVKRQFIPNSPQLQVKLFYARGKPYLSISFYPIYQNQNKLEKIVSLKIEVSENNKTSGLKSHNFYRSTSVLSTGRWVKIGIVKSGIYKITYEQLRSMGFNTPGAVRVFGNDNGELPYMNNIPVDDDLVENKVYYGNDYILFYATGPQRWQYDTISGMFLTHRNIYTDTAYYFLTDKNTGFNNAISTENVSGSASADISSYVYYDIHEDNLINILHSGRIWLGEDLSYNTTQSFNFHVENVLSESAKVRVALAARSSAIGTFTFTLPSGSQTISFTSVPGEEYNIYADYKVATYSFTPTSSDINFTISFNKPTASAQAWLDYIILNCSRKLHYNGEQFSFRSLQNIGAGKISQFHISGANSSLMVWDITDTRRPVAVNTQLSSGALLFKSYTDTLREFVVFSTSDAYSPIIYPGNYGLVANQNIHGVPSNTQLLIITNKKFLEGANQLAKLHRQNGLNVFVATEQQIFNEFSSGMSDVSAIRNFIRYTYLKTGRALKYVLLVGDGCYDNKCSSGGCPNYILTYQTYNSFNTGGYLSLVSDDFFGLLDDNEGELTGMLDVSVGRLPVKSEKELEDFINKLKFYLSADAMGDWTNRLTIIADDEQNFAFMNDAEALSDKIDTLYPYFRINKIYLDAYKEYTSAYGQSYPDVTVAINNAVKQGTLVMTFLGHGNMFLLAHEHILLKQDISKWDNFQKLLFFITGTCEFGKFDEYRPNDPNYSTSAAEEAVINPNGGAIGMLTTVRPSYISINAIITFRFFDYLFSNTLGDAFIKTKNSLSDYNKHTFSLLGDPALRLRYPYYNIRITDLQVQGASDTIRGLDKVKIFGEVRDNTDRLLNDFQGIVYPVLLGKKHYLHTLDNDGIGAFRYWDMNNVLFRGQASVSNGKFSFTFIVPKDIDYSYGKGRIVLYAKSNKNDAKGYKNIIIGGINTNAPVDNEGPRIRLFMNDTNFVNGGITTPSPMLLALLQDENGINTSSSGFGHSITAILDNDNRHLYLLNEYYQADLNTYKSGKVKFNFYNLKEGRHSLLLRAFDVYNNSSEATLDFIVESAEKLQIQHLLNYPNPFTTHTDFYFEHNKPGIPLQVLLQIFTLSGKLIKTFHIEMTTEGFRSTPISWDGLDDYGNRIARGVYIYKLTVMTPDGEKATAYEKLLILR